MDFTKKADEVNQQCGRIILGVRTGLLDVNTGNIAFEAVISKALQEAFAAGQQAGYTKVLDLYAEKPADELEDAVRALTAKVA